MPETLNNPTKLPFQKSFAFLIGINDYEHVNPLITAANDAQILAKELRDEHGYQVAEPLLNATKADILDLLQHQMPAMVGPEDRVFFYFAGHGIALDSDTSPRGFLVPADAKYGEEDSLVSMNLLHDAITSLPCRHGLLILDCCFAGAFKWSTGFRDVVFDLPGIIYEERFYQYTQDPAWQVITSSASDQKAVDILYNRSLGMRNESGATHSPFALALLEGLEGEADTVPKDRGDGVITATELYTYLRDRVEDETTEQGKRQSPSLFSLGKHDKGQYIFLHPKHPLNLPPIPNRNPFMGLNSYNEDDHLLFYGRDRVIEALDQLTADQQLVVVSGASGTGKSSVIKAGLLPLLREKGWQILPVIRPGKEPMKNIEGEILDGITNLDGQHPTLLIIDQYEELITQCLHPEERQAFEEQLLSWLQAHSQLHIVISIRSDFEPQFEEATLAQWWAKGRYVVPAFSQDELREVIIKPTVQEVLFFEPDTLVDKLVDEVNQAPGALPLLSFTLSELYHAYLNSGRTNRAFVMEDYEKLGGVIGALRTRANALYDELDRPHQDSMRKLMLRMVSLEGGELASRRVLSDELIFGDEQENKRIRTIADQLVEARLVSTGRDNQGRTYYEPAHDALVRAWARLWEWVKAVGEDKLSLYTKLSQAVKDYRDLLEAQPKKARDLLWVNDPRLNLLRSDIETKSHVLNAQETQFVKDSMKRRATRLRGIIALTLGVIVGLAGLAIYAIIQTGIAREKTREAEAAGLGSKALAVYPDDNTAAINLANLAYRYNSAEEAREAMYRINSNADSRFYKEIGQHQDTVTQVAFSPTGDTILSAGIDGQIILWDQAGHKINALCPSGSPITTISFSADGKYMLSGGEDGIARVMNLNGTVIQELSHEKPITATLLVRTADGYLAFSGDEEGGVWRWDLRGDQKKVFNGRHERIEHFKAIYPSVQESNWRLSDIEVSIYPDAIYFNEKRGKICKIDLEGNIFKSKEYDSINFWDELVSMDYDPSHRIFLEVTQNGFLTLSPDIFADTPESRLQTVYVNGEARLLPELQNEFRNTLPDIFMVDGEEIVWLSPNGQEKKRFSRHLGGIRSFAISTDGKHLVTAGNDGRILTWPIQPYMGPFRTIEELERQCPDRYDFFDFVFNAYEWSWQAKSHSYLGEYSMEEIKKEYQAENGNWMLRLVAPDQLILSRDGHDLQQIMAPAFTNSRDLLAQRVNFRLFAVSNDGRFIYTYSELFLYDSEDREQIFYAWPNYTYAWENGLIPRLTDEEIRKYKVPEAILTATELSASPASPPIIEEQTIDEICEEAWIKGASLPKPNKAHQQGETSELGIRDLYNHSKRYLGLNLHTLQNLSPVPIFLKGPHKGYLNLYSREFGHYNPEFLKWAKAHLLPAKENPALRKASQPFYENYIRDIARAFYLAYRLKNAVAKIRSKVMQEYEEAVGTNNYYTARMFWNRRRIDRTAPLFFDILKDLLYTYDDKWITKTAANLPPELDEPAEEAQSTIPKYEEKPISTPVFGTVTGDRVRLRSTPEIIDEPNHTLLYLSMNDKVEILEEKLLPEQSIPWFKIRIGGTVGWTRSDFIRKEEVTAEPTVEQPSAQSVTTTGYGISLASLRTQSQAELKLDELQKTGIAKLIIHPFANDQGEMYYRVINGPFPDEEAARKEMKRLKESLAMDGFVVKIE